MRFSWRILLSIAVAVVFLIPLFLGLNLAFIDGELFAQQPQSWFWLPRTTRNFSEAFSLVPLLAYTQNSLLVVGTAVPITWLVASTAGFGLSQLPDTWRRPMVLVSLGGMFIPAAAMWLMRFQIYRWLGIIDSIWALLIPAVAGTSPLFVLLFYWSFRAVPPEIFEAARIDGANGWTMWWTVARPLVQPTSAAVVLLAFTLYWSNFLDPVLYLYDPDKYTLPVGLQLVRQLDVNQAPLFMAAAMFAVIPSLFLFGWVQRRVLDGRSLAQLFERAA